MKIIFRTQKVFDHTFVFFSLCYFTYVAEREEDQIDVTSTEDSHNYSKIHHSLPEYNQPAEMHPPEQEQIVITEESTPILGETVEIDLKCAEKVTDSDVDDTDDYKTNAKSQLVISNILANYFEI